MISAVFKAVVSSARGIGRFDSDALPPYVKTDAEKSKGFGKVSINLSQSPYENYDSSVPAPEGSVKQAIDFLEGIGGQKHVASMLRRGDLWALIEAWNAAPEFMRDSIASIKQAAI